MKTAILNHDIISNGKNKTCYGKKGDKVTINVEKEDLLIVKGKDGQVFSVKNNDITILK